MTGKRTTIDKAKLYKLVKEGKSASEIMKALKINLKQGLKSALFDLSVEKNEVLVVTGMAKRTVGNKKINKMGLQIPLKQLSDHFQVGDEFEMKISKDKIVLAKVKK